VRLLPISEILADARKNSYAVGAFNVLNMEMIQAVVRAAEAEKSPVIIQVYYDDLNFAGGAYISAINKVAAEPASIPVALQLDHGQSFEQALSCMNCGFSSVMIDLSSLDFQENVFSTRKVVQEAHSRGISVEAELGKIFGGEEPIEKRNSSLTDPDLAVRFVDETGVDALAVSVGTAHGLYSSKPFVNFDLLRKLVQSVQVPIVVHGGSDTPNEDIVNMIRLGVTKINVGTDLMLAFKNGLKEALNRQSRDSHIRDVLDYARTKMETLVRKKIKLLNKIRTNGSY
jgi:ketose-bisphosphate aldolase